DQPDATPEIPPRDEGFNLVGSMIDQDENLISTMGGQGPQLTLKQRNAVHIDKRLRSAIQTLGQSRAFAAGEDHRLHRDAVSWRKISSIACRIAASDPSVGVHPVDISFCTE